MTLRKRRLGSQGLEVGAIGLGCMGMSQSYGPADETESLSTLHRAIELGCDFFDTAENYGPFTNEALLGRAFKDRRDKVVIATKFGSRFEGDKIVGMDSRPENIVRVVEGCLRRLQTDHIDLLYQHRLDRTVPIEDVAGTVSDLIKQGKVRYFGLSEVGVANLRLAHAVHPVSALQSEYSLWERNLEPEIIPVLRELGIGLVPFCPLGRGFLAGGGGVKRAEEYPEGDTRRIDPRYQGQNYNANVKATRIVFDIAASKGVKPGQIALAWLLHKGDDIVPIPGTKRRSFLEENVAAAAVRLDLPEMQKLDAALVTGTISGNRYADWIMATIDR